MPVVQARPSLSGEDSDALLKEAYWAFALQVCQTLADDTSNHWIRLSTTPILDEVTLDVDVVEGIDSGLAASRWRRKRDASRRVRLALVISDTIVMIGAYAAAIAVAAGTTDASSSLGVSATLIISVATLPLWLILLGSSGLYSAQRSRLVINALDESGKGAAAILAGGFALLVLGYVLSASGVENGFSVPAVAALVAVTLVGIPLVRTATRSVVVKRLAHRKRAIIVGSGVVATTVYEKLREHESLGVDVIGFADSDGNSVPGPVLGGTEDAAQICADHDIDHVIVAFQTGGHEELLELIRSLRRPRLQISLVPRAFEGFTAHAALDDVAGLPLVTLPPAVPGLAARATKRTFDIAVSAAALVLVSPLLLVTAIAVKLDSPGPIFFHQCRRGQHGSVFSIVKFRSMHTDAEERRDKLAHLDEVDGPLFKIKGRDPRVTRVGHFLRRTSIDELPQLWNVLVGDMSLVGPRPFILDEADEITGWGARRLETRPGITGVWQTLGRNDLSFDEMVRLDYLYVTNWSLWWDIKLLAKTVPVVLARRGAY